MIRTEDITFLGVILDENLSWKSHISHIVKFLNLLVLLVDQVLVSLSLPYSLFCTYFQHCIIVWGSTYPTNLNRLTLLQNAYF